MLGSRQVVSRDFTVFVRGPMTVKIVHKINTCFDERRTLELCSVTTVQIPCIYIPEHSKTRAFSVSKLSFNH